MTKLKENLRQLVAELRSRASFNAPEREKEIGQLIRCEMGYLLWDSLGPPPSTDTPSPPPFNDEDFIKRLAIVIGEDDPDQLLETLAQVSLRIDCHLPFKCLLRYARQNNVGITVSTLLQVIVSPKQHVEAYVDYFNSLLTTDQESLR